MDEQGDISPTHVHDLQGLTCQTGNGAEPYLALLSKASPFQMGAEGSQDKICSRSHVGVVAAEGSHCETQGINFHKLVTCHHTLCEGTGGKETESTQCVSTDMSQCNSTIILNISVHEHPFLALPPQTMTSVHAEGSSS